MDSADLQRGQIIQVDGDLALSGGGPTTECDVTGLDERGKSTSNSQLGASGGSVRDGPQ